MKYDITKSSSPKMPELGKGTECIKLMLSQTSKGMNQPLVPMLFPILLLICQEQNFSIRTKIGRNRAE
ncbi:MAG: hypothetical protein MJZ81_11665 [Bacteroidales bacterium]|nr:hypothetical protein [Bacteroidales bacterium]